MIDFKKEILKYKPVLEMDDVEKSINSDEVQDVIDLIKQFSEKSKNTGKE